MTRRGPERGIACVPVREHPTEPVLLLRRAFGEYQGAWCFVAGRIEAGELAVDAAVRELREETGIESAMLTPLWVSDDVPGLELNVFVARLARTPRIHLDSEHDEWRWASFARARQLLPLAAQRRMLGLAQRP